MTLNPDAYTTIDIDKRSDGVTVATLVRRSCQLGDAPRAGLAAGRRQPRP